VFVNSSVEEIILTQIKYKLDYIQLHGNENAEFCKELFLKNIKIIKAFGIDEYFDFSETLEYKPYCSYFLFDTKTESHGGSGKKFDWQILNFNKVGMPFFLSGGIDEEDIEEIKKIKNKNFFAIDINSRFEISPALKNIEKIKLFIDKLN